MSVRAAAAAALVAGLLWSIGSAFAENQDSINYNASKSNTGNLTTTDRNTGISTGRRQHQPLTAKHPHHKSAAKSHRHRKVKPAAASKPAGQSDMAVKTTGVPEH